MVAVLRGVFAAVWLLFSVAAATAQAYPNKAVRIVVGFTAGGPTVAIRAPAHPIARALLKSRVGDVLNLVTPAGTTEIEVTAVDYPQGPASPGA